MKERLSRRSIIKASVLAPLVPAAAAAAEKKEEDQVKWDASSDIVVAGGGIAGVMAAMQAAKANANVILLQASTLLGGNSAISSGWVRSACTKRHDKKGVKDTAEAYRGDILACGQGTRDKEKAKIIASRSRDFVNFLIDSGVPFTDDEDRFNSSETLRVVKAKGGGGAIMKGAIAALRKIPNIRVLCSTRLVGVVSDAGRTRVIGARAADKSGKEILIKTRSLVIATGGFGRNQTYIERLANQWAKTGGIMDVCDLGDGLKIATGLGAGALNLNVCMVCPTLEKTLNVFFSSAPVVNGAIFVNEKGRRFTNEYVICTQTNIDMLKQKEIWEITTPAQHAVVDSMIRMGAARKCDTVEELAALIGCPVEGLKADIEEHNRQTALPPEKRDDVFGRKAYGKPLTAPCYAVSIMPVMIDTAGGFTIDKDARIVSLMGRPVMEGLHGAGAVAFGEHFAKGCRSGEAYVYSGVTGMAAGENAAKHASAAKWEESAMKKTFVLILSMLFVRSAGAAGLACFHKAKGAECAACHVTPNAVPTAAQCTACHKKDGLAQATANVRPANPHVSPHYDLDCTDRHKGHQKSVDFCAQCHKFNFSVK